MGGGESEGKSPHVVLSGTRNFWAPASLQDPWLLEGEFVFSSAQHKDISSIASRICRCDSVEKVCMHATSGGFIDVRLYVSPEVSPSGVGVLRV